LRPPLILLAPGLSTAANCVGRSLRGPPNGLHTSLVDQTQPDRTPSCDPARLERAIERQPGLTQHLSSGHLSISWTGNHDINYVRTGASSRHIFPKLFGTATLNSRSLISHQQTAPPSTIKSRPVQYDDAGLAKNTAGPTMSRGTAIRPRGVSETNWSKRPWASGRCDMAVNV
jgi:hypothetical protein